MLDQNKAYYIQAEPNFMQRQGYEPILPIYATKTT